MNHQLTRTGPVLAALALLAAPEKRGRRVKGSDRLW
jgi:hypothetical protein